MIYAILFVLTFLLGAVSYHFTNRWWLGVLIAMAIYIADVVSDTVAQEYWLISLIFGLPIVFLAALLGAYVVERHRADPDTSESEEPSSDGETTTQRFDA